MRLDRARAIEGWQIEEDLQWLAEAASTHQRIVEVGCWMGRSTMALADNTRGTIWAVDHFQGSVEHWDGLADKPDDWLHNKFSDNLREHIFSHHVVVIDLPSVEAAALMSRSQFDMIFIDGAHDYGSIRTDIYAWRPLVAPGGILCGHDRGYGPIARALRHTLGTIEEAGANIWVKR